MPANILHKNFPQLFNFGIDIMDTIEVYLNDVLTASATDETGLRRNTHIATDGVNTNGRPSAIFIYASEDPDVQLATTISVVDTIPVFAVRQAILDVPGETVSVPTTETVSASDSVTVLVETAILVSEAEATTVPTTSTVSVADDETLTIT